MRNRNATQPMEIPPTTCSASMISALGCEFAINFDTTIHKPMVSALILLCKDLCLVLLSVILNATVSNLCH